MFSVINLTVYSRDFVLRTKKRFSWCRLHDTGFCNIFLSLWFLLKVKFLTRFNIALQHDEYHKSTELLLYKISSELYVMISKTLIMPPRL